MTTGTAAGFAGTTGIENHPGHSSQKSHGRRKGGVRSALASAKTIGELNAAAGAEAKRITGRDIQFEMGGDQQLAAEHVEGILRGLERYPSSPLRRVRQGSDADTFAYAVTSRDGRTITFTDGAQRFGADSYRERLARAEENGDLTAGTPMGVAMHEFGHTVVVKAGTASMAANTAHRLAKAAKVSPTSRYIEDHVSTYAADGGSDELAAEAFADVMVNGSSAHPASQEIAAAIDTAYSAAGGTIQALVNLLVPRLVNEVDLAEVQRQYEQRLDDLLQEWTTITAKQRGEILDQVRLAVTSDDLAALASIHVNTAEAAEALTEAMSDMALEAARGMSKEAQRQGVRIDPVATDRSLFAAIAAAIATLLAQGLTNSAGREALRQWSVSTSGDDIIDSVREHLESLSNSFVEANLGGALTSAQNTGRLETALAGPSAALYASETMDRNTCLAPEVLVTTRRGRVYAKDVDLSDGLLTHRGRWVAPSRITVSEVEEQLVGVALSNGRSLRLTWDHPVLVRTDAGFRWVLAGDLTVGALVVDEQTLEIVGELGQVDPVLGQAPDRVPPVRQVGGLASVDIGSLGMPVLAVGLDHETLADEEVDHPGTDLGLRAGGIATVLEDFTDATFDAGLGVAGAIAVGGTESLAGRGGRDDPEAHAAVGALDGDGWSSAGLAAMPSALGLRVAEVRATAGTYGVDTASRATARDRAVVVPMGSLDRDGELDATVGADLADPPQRRPNFGSHLRVGELALDRAVDSAVSRPAGDLLTTGLASRRRVARTAVAPARECRVALAPHPGRDGTITVQTRLVHDLSLIKTAAVATIRHEPYRGEVYDFTVPGDHTFWAEGVLVHNCGPCAAVDGKWLGNTDDPDTPARVAEVYPNGGYRYCEGGVRCRGTVVSVYRPEQVQVP